jgi:hypothetical protein
MFQFFIFKAHFMDTKHNFWFKWIGLKFYQNILKALFFIELKFYISNIRKALW